ncbi:hypothetical protein K2X05_12105 [bacterium]|nr:hypothetical protein [bacterium]
MALTLAPQYYLLGLIALIVFFYLLWNEKIRFEIDEAKKRILYYKKNRFYQRLKVIPFHQVESVGIRKVGREHKGIVIYFVDIRLKNGGTLRTDIKSFSREDIQQEADRLAQQLSVPSAQLFFTSMSREILFLVSLIFAVAGYVLYYRATVGVPCVAMWFGTFPIFFIGTVTGTLYISLRGYTLK